MSNMSPLAKYGTIAILSVVAVIVAWQVWLAVRPSPETQEMERSTREFLEEICKRKPNDKRCEKLK